MRFDKEYSYGDEHDAWKDFAKTVGDSSANMLVCDCKLGYHIYCLTPSLKTVPDGDWKCPVCAKQ